MPGLDCEGEGVAFVGGVVIAFDTLEEAFVDLVITTGYNSEYIAHQLPIPHDIDVTAKRKGIVPCLKNKMYHKIEAHE